MTGSIQRSQVVRRTTSSDPLAAFLVAPPSVAPSTQGTVKRHCQFHCQDRDGIGSSFELDERCRPYPTASALAAGTGRAAPDTRPTTRLRPAAQARRTSTIDSGSAAPDAWARTRPARRPSGWPRVSDIPRAISLEDKALDPALIGASVRRAHSVRPCVWRRVSSAASISPVRAQPWRPFA